MVSGFSIAGQMNALYKASWQKASSHHISWAVWGPCLARKRTEFQCDNQSLVVAINKGTVKDTLVMHLLHYLWFSTAIFDINFIVMYTVGVNNDAADLFSRNHIRQFLQHALKPHSSPHQYLSPH